MYSTLAQLKENKACVPGFTRVASFFGVGTEIVNQKIPLHVIALLGGYEDATWALQNSITIDPEEFFKIRDRTLVSVWHNLMHRHLMRSTRASSLSNSVRLALDEAYSLGSAQDILSFIEKHRWTGSQHPLWTRVINNEIFLTPADYLTYIIGQVDTSFSVTSTIGKRLLSFRTGSGRQLPWSPAETLNDGDEDDGDEDPDTDNDNDNEIPLFENVLTKGRSKGRCIAHLLSSDPYDFLTTLKYKMPIGSAIVGHLGDAILGDGLKPIFKIEINDLEKLFTVLHVLNARLPIEDQQG